MLCQWITLLNSGKRIDNYLVKNNIKKIAIWGKGQICELLLKQLTTKIEIISIIETNPNEKYFLNIPVVNLNRVSDNVQMIVVLPVCDIKIIEENIRKKLVCQIVGLDNLIQSVLESNI